MSVQFKDIPGFPDYQASYCGQIKNARRDVIMKQQTNKKTNCKIVQLYDKDKKRGVKHNVHRLVAMAWLDNFDSKLQVNHIDGNRLNNSVDNLEMCTAGDNMRHAWCLGLMDNVVKAVSRPVLCIDTGVVYPSVQVAARETGTSAGCIYRICQNVTGFKTAKGPRFRYT